jgi:hypothetical protein
MQEGTSNSLIQEIAMNIGISELKRQLEEMGFVVSMDGDNFLFFKYKIPLGRFRDKEIDLGFEAPQFPLNPPSGLIIKPHLLPVSGGGGAHPNGGIHSRPSPSTEWQYWSRPFPGWETSGKNAKAYMAFVRTLFDFE